MKRSSSSRGSRRRRPHSALDLRLGLVLLVVFSVGIATGAVIYKLAEGTQEIQLSDNSLDLLNSRIENLETKIENLTVELGSLENVVENLAENLGEIPPRENEVWENEIWSVEEVYQQIKNSVVEIDVVAMGFFGPMKGQGSGFVYGEQGYILTNQHVVEDARHIVVKFYDGSIAEATLVADDPYSDVAVIKVNPSELDIELSPLELGDSSDLKPGDRIIAVGTPFGLYGTITAGVVSQVGRMLTTESGYPIPGVIQIDAAINPGNSGGPLLDFNGRVVGITTAIVSQTGSFSGIGFAIPSNLVQRVAEGLIENGEYKHPWIGISGEDVDYEIAEEMGLKKAKGVVVRGILPDSPAEGVLEEGDVILSVDNVEIFGIGDLLSYLELNKTPGDEIALTVLREGTQTKVELELGERP